MIPGSSGLLFLVSFHKGIVPDDLYIELFLGYSNKFEDIWIICLVTKYLRTGAIKYGQQCT